MKKNDLTVKVKLELPKEVITNILNKGLSRFEEAKYLLLAHYYQHQFFIVGVKEMNKYLGIKDAKGRDMRLNMIHWNIITPIESSKVKRNNKGQFFKKGYDIYQPVNNNKMTEYLIISEDARALTGKYSGELLEALNLVAEKANSNDVKRYENLKAEYKAKGILNLSEDLKAVLCQEISKKMESKPMFPEDDEIFDFELPALEENIIEVNGVTESHHGVIPSTANDEFDIFIENKLKSAKVQPIYWQNAIQYIKENKEASSAIELGKLISISTASTQVIINKVKQYWN